MYVEPRDQFVHCLKDRIEGLLEYLDQDPTGPAIIEELGHLTLACEFAYRPIEQVFVGLIGEMDVTLVQSDQYREARFYLAEGGDWL